MEIVKVATVRFVAYTLWLCSDVNSIFDVYGGTMSEFSTLIRTHQRFCGIFGQQILSG